MKTTNTALVVLLVIASLTAAGAQTLPKTLTVKGEEYTGVFYKERDETHVKFKHDSGLASVLIADLPADIQKDFPVASAKAAEQPQEEAKKLNELPHVQTIAANEPVSDADGLRIITPDGFRDMPLGCTSQIVANIMGPPQKKEIIDNCFYYSYKNDRPYYLVRKGVLPSAANKAITFRFDKATSILKSITIEDTFEAKTDRGINFGVPLAKVMQIYGKPTKQYPENFDTESENAFVEYKNEQNHGILFDFRDGVLTSIAVYVIEKR